MPAPRCPWERALLALPSSKHLATRPGAAALPLKPQRWLVHDRMATTRHTTIHRATASAITMKIRMTRLKPMSFGQIIICKCPPVHTHTMPPDLWTSGETLPGKVAVGFCLPGFRIRVLPSNLWIVFLQTFELEQADKTSLNVGCQPVVHKQ